MTQVKKEGMKNPEIDRLKAKLRLWETPGFSQFLQDLSSYMEIDEIPRFSDVVKRRYIEKIKEIENKDNKFKQGELKL